MTGTSEASESTFRIVSVSRRACPNSPVLDAITWVPGDRARRVPAIGARRRTCDHARRTDPIKEITTTSGETRYRFIIDMGKRPAKVISGAYCR